MSRIVSVTLLLVTSLSSTMAMAQLPPQWSRTSPVPEAETLLSVDMWDASLGIACGAGGIVTVLSDSGRTRSFTSTISQHDLNDVCFASSNNAMCVGNRGEMYRSSDSGRTWAQLKHSVNHDLHALDVGSNGTVIVVGTSGTILRSTDSGSTWIDVSIQTDQTLRTVAGSDGLWISAGTGGTLLRSLDDGITWSSMSGIDGITDRPITAVSILPTIPRRIILSQDPVTIATSVDEGASWSVRFLDSAVASSDSRATTHSLTATPNGRNIFLVVEDLQSPYQRSCWSNDGGSTWQFNDYWFGNTSRSAQFISNSFGCSVGDRGCYLRMRVRNDSLRFSLDNGVSRRPQCAERDPEGTVYLGGSNGIAWVHRSRDNGRSWTPILTPLPFYEVKAISAPSAKVIVVALDTLIGGRYLGRIMASKDSGATWNTFVFGDSSATNGLSMSDESHGVRTTFASYSRTSDSGITWDTRPLPPLVEYITGPVAMFDERTYCFVARNDDGQYRVYRTNEDGGSWQISDPLPTPIQSWRFLSVREGWAIGSKSNGIGHQSYDVILRTDDGGITWTTVMEKSNPPMSFGLTGIDFVDAENGIAVGRAGKILITADGGRTWTPELWADPNNYDFSGVRQMKDGSVLTFTSDATYTLRRDFPLTSSVALSESDQRLVVYPNPASDFLSISSSDPIEYVTLTDILGATMTLEQAPQINVSMLSAGMYLLSIQFLAGNWATQVVYIAR